MKTLCLVENPMNTTTMFHSIHSTKIQRNIEHLVEIRGIRSSHFDSRLSPRFLLSFAAIMRTPQSLAIFLALLCSIAISRSQAPSDRVFLTERFLVKTHSSLTALAPGTALRVTSENGDTSHVTDGTATFDVPNNKLTKDADLAARLAQNEYAAQEAALAQQMESYRQAEAAKYAEQERQAAVQRQAEQQRQAEIQQQQQAAQWQAQQQPEIPWALQAVQAIQAQQTRQTELQQAEQQRASDARARRRRMAEDDDAQLAQREAAKAENRIQGLQRQAGEVRERERYEYNKAASERGNQATYNVERAYDGNIQSLRGQINNAEREKAYWENRASQAEQQH